MSSPPRRRKKSVNFTSKRDFSSSPKGGERKTKTTRQPFLGNADEDFCSQKPKRRLFFDSNDWGKSRTFVENEEENDSEDSDKDAAAYRNKCLEQKLARAEALHLLSVQSKREKANAFNCRHEDVVKAQKNFNQEKNLQKAQMLEERLRSAAMKRSYVLFRKGIRAKCGVQQSPEKALERLQHLHRVERVQRLWRVYTESRSSTEALGKSIIEKLSFNIAKESSDYDEFVSLLQDANVLDGVRLWLKCLDSRLNALGAEQSITTQSHLRLLFPPTNNKSSSCHHQRCNRSIDSLDDFVIPRFPTRILMCAYMVCAHPEMVTGEYAAEEEEPYEVRELRSTSARLVKAIDATIETRLNSAGPVESGAKNALMFNEAVLQFAEIWDEYVRAFSIWKTNDATALEAELVRIAVAMEASMLRKCGERSSQTNVEELTDDISAIREQTCSDRELLRTKVREISGDVGVLRFDDAIRAARESVRAEQTSTTDSIDGSSLGRSGGNASEKKFEDRRKQRFQHSQQLLREKEEAKKNLEQSKNERLQRMTIMHELLADITWLPFQLEDSASNLKAKGTPPTTDLSPAGLEHRVHVQAKKAYWDAVRETLESPTLDANSEDDIVSMNIRELVVLIHSLVPEPWKRNDSTTQRALEMLNERELARIIFAQKDTALLKSLLTSTLDASFALLVALGSEAREPHSKAKRESLLSALENASCSETIVLALQFLWDMANELKEDISKGKIIVAVEKMRRLLRGPDRNTAICWIQDTFGQLHGLDATPCDEALPNTKKWLFRSACELAPLVESSGLVGEVLKHKSSMPKDDITHNIPKIIRAGLKDTSTSSKREVGSLTETTDESVTVNWACVRASSCEGVVRLMFVDLVCHREEHSALPETLRFDASRIHRAQDSFQRILLSCACLALVEQVCPVGVSVTSEMKHDLSERVSAILHDGTSKLRDVATEVARTVGSMQNTSTISLIERMLLKLIGEGNQEETKGPVKSSDVISKALLKNVREALTARVLGGKNTRDTMISRLNNCRAGIVAKEIDALAVRIHALAQTSFVLHKGAVYAPLVLKAYETSEEL